MMHKCQSVPTIEVALWIQSACVCLAHTPIRNVQQLPLSIWPSSGMRQLITVICKSEISRILSNRLNVYYYPVVENCKNMAYKHQTLKRQIHEICLDNSQITTGNVSNISDVALRGNFIGQMNRYFLALKLPLDKIQPSYKTSKLVDGRVNVQPIL